MSSIFLSVCLPVATVCLPVATVCLPVCLPEYLPACLPPACHAYMPACLSDCVCLPPYQSNCLYEVIELTVVGKLRLYVTVGNQ
jgi:hypothetical protein